MATRDSLMRAIFVQEVTGWCVDIPGHNILLTNPLKQSEKTMIVDGASRPISRKHDLNLPIIEECHISALDDMCAQAWPVTAYFFGMNVHQVWNVPEALDLIDQRRGPGTMAGTMVKLQSTVFNGAIFQSDNLLEGFPWFCTDSTPVPGTAGSGSGSGSGDLPDYVLLSTPQQGFQGPKWQPGGAGASVSFAGSLTKAGANDPILELLWPFQGAQLSMEGEGVEFSLTFYDWSGNLLATITKTTSDDAKLVTVPDRTWRIQVTVESADNQPVVRVANAGVALDPRVGVDVRENGVVRGVPPWSS